MIFSICEVVLYMLVGVAVGFFLAFITSIATEIILPKRESTGEAYIRNRNKEKR